ncbi:hypothetical protein QTP70_022466 [Hemibagrus guttatus]|uniref:CCHC-type domain-containing protein n=1 Tax=Hemibagrus guttatus TaxID=175788 RepID=A0AAE0PZP0_9TELE|nr:hypothetical protein QTP70_022466 [Hemibagrus guttatus]
MTIAKELSCYGKLVTPIRKIHMGSKAPESRNSKIAYFKRLVYMVLNNGVEELDLAMTFGVDGFDYTVFVTTDSGMKCFNCGETGHLVRACPEKVKTDGATDRQAEQTRTKVSSDTEGDGPSISVSPVAESIPADPPAAKPVAAAASMLDPVVTVPPAVETGLSGGKPGATVAKPAGDKAGTSDPAKSDKEMSEPTSEPPVQISQVEELKSSLDVAGVADKQAKKHRCRGERWRLHRLKLACIDPPPNLLADLQAMMVDFFWDKLHWLPQSILYLPKEESGQGLIQQDCSISSVFCAEAPHWPRKPLMESSC